MDDRDRSHRRSRVNDELRPCVEGPIRAHAPAYPTRDRARRMRLPWSSSTSREAVWRWPSFRPLRRNTNGRSLVSAPVIGTSRTRFRNASGECLLSQIGQPCRSDDRGADVILTSQDLIDCCEVVVDVASASLAWHSQGRKRYQLAATVVGAGHAFARLRRLAGENHLTI